MKKFFLFICIFNFLACTSLNTIRTIRNLSSDEHAPTATELSRINIDTDGAWCWFGDPRAIANDTDTYISYLTAAGKIVVSKLNHATKTQTKIIFPMSTTVDDHNNPALTLLSDGNIMVFFSEHNGSAMYYSKTKTPGKLSTFAKLKKIDDLSTSYNSKGFTYPNPISINENGVDKIFLFWRGSDWTPSFSVTANNGESWTQKKSIVKNGIQRPYTKYFADSESRIHITMTDGHPSTNPENSVYYMYYKNGAFYKANNELIGSLKEAPFNLSQLDIVYSANKNTSNLSKNAGRAWVWSIAVDNKNMPLIGYSATREVKNHAYYVAKWNGIRWVLNFIEDGGGTIQKSNNNYNREDYYSGGIYFDQSDVDNLYIGKQAVNKNHVIQNWRFDTQLEKYRFVQNLSDIKKSSFRPLVPLWKGTNTRSNGLKVLWMTGNYEYYTDYNTSIEGIFSEDPF